jgi:hypothetical protein
VVSPLALRTNPHPVRWVTAAPLWSSLLAADDPSKDDLDRMQQPALLRLTSDDFMDELAEVLADDPAQLRELEATPKSYRAAPPGAGDGYEPPIGHVKLYQPAHGHFNLVAATLVCRVAGLPDRAVDPATSESVSFVMRRVAGADELAWDGSNWVEIEAKDKPAENEQLAPLFPLPYRTGDRTRRLFVGLLPTSSIESFKSGGGALSFSPQPGDRPDEPPDRRLEDLDTKVIDPLFALAASTIPPDLSPSDQAAFASAEAAQRLETSRFLLLDLGDFLLRNAPQLWAAVQNEREPSVSGLAGAYNLLRNTWADVDRRATWLGSLLSVWAERDRIWGDVDDAPAFEVNLAHGTMDPTELRAKIALALPARTEAQKQEPQPPFEVPKLDPRPDTFYVVRCVYRRPICGPLHPDLVSDPSQPFAIAGFFDLDAPARPVHISLPIDTTIAGLRKAPKNVSFLISTELRAQMERVTSLKKATDGQLASAQSFDLGVICSMSIPIITICALILMMLILIVLNMVFWWMPFVRTCFPIPLKAKE